MKTQNDILTDFYKVIKASPIDALNGGIYKKTRPTDSKLEDCVLSLIPGTNSKFLQDGVLYVKIFYSDIYMSNTYSEDAINGSAKERLLFDLSGDFLKLKGYSFDVQTRETYTEKVLDSITDSSAVNEHFAILKINFKLLL